MNLIESSTVLFPHDFTRVDHQMENSLNFTLEIDTTSSAE